MNFWYEAFVLSRCKRKPDKPFSAGSAGTFFMGWYLVTIAVVMAFWYSILSSSTLAKSCKQLQIDVADAAGTTGDFDKLIFNMDCTNSRLPEPPSEYMFWQEQTKGHFCNKNFSLNKQAASIFFRDVQISFAILNMPKNESNSTLSDGKSQTQVSPLSSIEPLPMTENALLRYFGIREADNISKSVQAICNSKCGPNLDARTLFSVFLNALKGADSGFSSFVEFLSKNTVVPWSCFLAIMILYASKLNYIKVWKEDKVRKQNMISLTSQVKHLKQKTEYLEKSLALMRENSDIGHVFNHE